jgi:response regulator of citrate/malate metabolism
MIRTLVIEDDFRVAAVHAAHVERAPGFTVVDKAHTARDAADAIVRLRPDLALLDLYLPDGDGLDLIRSLTEIPGPHPDFIVITAARDADTIRGAIQLGAVHYLVKPFSYAKLRDRLAAYRELHRRRGALGEASQDDVDALYAALRTPASLPLPKRHSTPTMALVRQAVERAKSDVSATEVAEILGISRPTAQRYLSYLAQHGIVRLDLHYGAPGRPEQRYRALAAQE